MNPASARRGALGVLALLTAVVAAVTGTAVPEAMAQQSASVVVERTTANQPFEYSPDRVQVDKGGRVTFSNPRIHTTGAAEDHPTNCRQGTSKGKCPWTSEPMPPGGSFTLTFPAEGTFSYFCAVHPYMQGVIVVGDGEPDPAPSPSPSPSPTASQQPAPPPASQEPSEQPSTEPEPAASSEAPSEPEADEDEAATEPEASDEPAEDGTTGPGDDAEDPTIGEGLDELGEDLGELGEDLGQAGDAMNEGTETAMESVMRAAARMFAVLVLLVTAAVLWFVRRRSTS